VKGEALRLNLCPGDKVMQIENDCDKEVYNRVVAYFGDVDPKPGELNGQLVAARWPTASANSIF
jgi:hypothetical protein